MTQNNKSYWTGFLSGTTVLALGMVTLLLGSGFQGTNLKIGVVDSQKAQQGMEMFKAMEEEFKNAIALRQSVIEFLGRYSLLRLEDAQKFKKLTLQATKTDAEKAELEKIKGMAMDAKKKFEDLQIKQNPTQDDLKLLDDLRNRQASVQEYMQQLNQEFTTELKAKQDNNVNSMSEAYKAAVDEVGKKQSYSIVFDKGVAPFSANDITGDVVKSINKK